MENYTSFIESKSQWSDATGFKVDSLPDCLKDFQAHLVEWALHQGRAALFEACGLGKTIQEVVWCQKIIERENKPALIVTPLAVSQQTIREAEKFGFDAKRSRDGFFDGSRTIWVTNYEQLHKLNPNDFCAVACDESSGVKDDKTQRKKAVKEFTRRMKYRLLATATPSPNDFHELGTSSEILGSLGFRDMITKFFKQEQSGGARGWGRTKYRFRGHAEKPFWSWVCSWSRSCRSPEDLGFNGDEFKLPPLDESQIVVEAARKRDGYLFSVPARGFREEGEERRRTINERCEMAADIANKHEGFSVLWCKLNPEGDLLEKLTDDSVQVKGSMPDEAKEEALVAFSEGQYKRMVIKPKIGAWGLNWQHADNVVLFPTHSYEEYHQLISRCHRFGQQKTVKVRAVCSEGEEFVIANLQRKKAQSERMFDELVAHMNDSMRLVSSDNFPNKEALPQWL